MAAFALRASSFLMPSGTLGEGYLVVEDGRIGGWQAERPSVAIVDRTGCIVAPGLVDTHIHGFCGHDVMDADADGLREVSAALARHGVTSWLPTTLTASVDQLDDVCASVAEAARDTGGAKIQGIFFEGPFFTERHKGAQNPIYFIDPTMDAVRRWQASAQGLVRKLSLAPEREGAAEFCRAATEAGFAVAIGHSDATLDEALACVSAGASIFVHTYNAMSPLNHRAPGMVGAAMATPSTYAEVICDGHHVHPAAVRALVAAKGRHHVVLITDCLSVGGMPEGDYHIGELPIRLEGGVARLADETHNLAGSTLTLDAAVRNVVAWGVASLEDAVRMASENPARSAGIDGRCGTLSSGHPADVVVLGPDLSVRETYLDGRCAFVS